MLILVSKKHRNVSLSIFLLSAGFVISGCSVEKSSYGMKKGFLLPKTIEKKPQNSISSGVNSNEEKKEKPTKEDFKKKPNDLQIVSSPYIGEFSEEPQRELYSTIDSQLQRMALIVYNNKSFDEILNDFEFSKYSKEELTNLLKILRNCAFCIIGNVNQLLIEEGGNINKYDKETTEVFNINQNIEFFMFKDNCEVFYAKYLQDSSSFINCLDYIINIFRNMHVGGGLVRVFNRPTKWMRNDRLKNMCDALQEISTTISKIGKRFIKIAEEPQNSEKLYSLKYTVEELKNVIQPSKEILNLLLNPNLKIELGQIDFLKYISYEFHKANIVCIDNYIKNPVDSIEIEYLNTIVKYIFGQFYLDMFVGFSLIVSKDNNHKLNNINYLNQLCKEFQRLFFKLNPHSENFDIIDLVKYKIKSDLKLELPEEPLRLLLKNNIIDDASSIASSYEFRDKIIELKKPNEEQEISNRPTSPLMPIKKSLNKGASNYNRSLEKRNRSEDKNNFEFLRRRANSLEINKSLIFCKEKDDQVYRIQNELINLLRDKKSNLQDIRNVLVNNKYFLEIESVDQDKSGVIIIKLKNNKSLKTHLTHGKNANISFEKDLAIAIAEMRSSERK